MTNDSLSYVIIRSGTFRMEKDRKLLDKKNEEIYGKSVYKVYFF